MNTAFSPYLFLRRWSFVNALVIIFLVVHIQANAEMLPVLPYPQQVKEGNSSIDLTGNIRFDYSLLNAATASSIAFHGKSFEQKQGGKAMIIRLQLLGKNKVSEWQRQIGEEGYLLVIDEKEQSITANTETGLFYGLQTLRQLIRNKWTKAITITDWPVLPFRAIYDDISRGPVPTVAFIKKQIERLSEIKINCLSFYIEHVVQTRSHPDFAPKNGKLTISDIKELVAYAGKFHMQLTGSFQSFGHFEKILSLPQYKSMGETSTLISPVDPKAKQFLSDVIGELCDAFSGPYFNVNCDETFGIADGRSKKYIDSIGIPKFYSDHIKFLYDIVKKHGKTLMIWGDVALQHQEILDLLPKDIVYLTWEYGDQKSFDEWIKPFEKRGLEFIVCPGILNSYRMFPDMVMAKANIAGFVSAGIKSKTAGVMTTIWDDGGAFLFSGDWYGVYVAAEKSWNIDQQGNTNYDDRFEIVAYGRQNNYTEALWKLMELRNVPLTYNLNDQLWNQKILPVPGKSLILNNSSAPAAKKILQDAGKLINGTKADSYQMDLTALKYAIDQYALIIDSRLILADAATKFSSGKNLGSGSGGRVHQIDPGPIKLLMQRYQHMKSVFINAWNVENQPYWLNIAFKPYDDKIAALNALLKKLKIPGSESKSAVGLNLIINDHFYFTNWMLGGPFPISSPTTIPGFLYSEKEENNHPPSPGDFTHYLGKTYRWQKFASREGGIVDLYEYYDRPAQAIAYAYCSMTTTEALTTDAFIDIAENAEIFCNGIKINPEPFAGVKMAGVNSATSMQHAASGTERKISLKLNPGINHLLIKAPESGTDWAFTFRLDPKINVTNSKHKYKLNPKTIVHEAE